VSIKSEGKLLLNSLYFRKYILPDWLERNERAALEFIEMMRQDPQSEGDIQHHFERLAEPKPSKPVLRPLQTREELLDSCYARPWKEDRDWCKLLYKLKPEWQAEWIERRERSEREWKERNPEHKVKNHV
jgi:hypothetical protein